MWHRYGKFKADCAACTVSGLSIQGKVGLPDQGTAVGKDYATL